jgi:integrase
MNVAGLKFLYGVTLDRPKVAERLLWPKVPHKKPVILSGSEVEKLLGAVSSPVASMVLATAYGAGLRISEACRLRPEDIDSWRCGRTGRRCGHKGNGSSLATRKGSIWTPARQTMR